MPPRRCICGHCEPFTPEPEAAVRGWIKRHRERRTGNRAFTWIEWVCPACAGGLWGGKMLSAAPQSP